MALRWRPVSVLYACFGDDQHAVIRQRTARSVNSVSPIRIAVAVAQLGLAVELLRVEQGAVGRVHVLDEVGARRG